jgi:hypothetical protein
MSTIRMFELILIPQQFKKYMKKKSYFKYDNINRYKLNLTDEFEWNIN